MKEAVNKDYYDNNLLSSNNKTDILSKNITELRKGEFEEVTSGQLKAKIIQLLSSTTSGGFVWIDDQTFDLVSLKSDKLSKLTNKITEIETNIVRFGKKISAEKIYKYNQLKLEFDNDKFNPTITNIQLGEACVDRWRGLRETHILIIRIVIKFIIAILIESKLLDNKEQARLEMHYEFNQKDILKEIESYFTRENESTNSTK